MLAYGTMVHVAEAAAAETGIDAEVIDLRTLLPLDLDTIVASVKKTGRCVVVHEATLTSGFGAELVALVQEHCFYHLEAPVVRVTGWDTPYPHAQEWDYFPGPARVGRALHRDDGGVTMAEHVIKLPDVGEGVAEAELVEWHVKVGDLVREDEVLAAVMTDKATVEIPSPVDGDGRLARRRDRRHGRRRRADRAAEGRGRGRYGSQRRRPALPTGPRPSRGRASAAVAPTPVESSSATLTEQPRLRRQRPPPPLRGGRQRSGREPARRAGGAPRPEGEKPTRLARRAAARQRGRHRPAPGARHRPGRAHHA